MPFPDPTSLNHSSMVTHLHLKTIRWVGVEILTKIIKPCQTKSYRSAQIDEWILRKETFACRSTLHVTRVVDDAGELDPATVELTQRSSGIRGAPCAAVVQARNLQGCDDADVVVAAADSQGSSGTVDYTRNDTAATAIDLGTVEMSLVQPQVSSGTEGKADEVEVQTGSTPNPSSSSSSLSCTSSSTLSSTT